eukprot:6246937-Pyramimonas_sp.AAC.1
MAPGTVTSSSPPRPAPEGDTTWARPPSRGAGVRGVRPPDSVPRVVRWPLPLRGSGAARLRSSSLK